MPKDLNAEQKELLEEVRALGAARWGGAPAARRFVRVDQQGGGGREEGAGPGKDSKDSGKDSGKDGKQHGKEGDSQGKKGWWPLS